MCVGRVTPRGNVTGWGTVQARVTKPDALAKTLKSVIENVSCFSASLSLALHGLGLSLPPPSLLLTLLSPPHSFRLGLGALVSVWGGEGRGQGTWDGQIKPANYQGCKQSYMVHGHFGHVDCAFSPSAEDAFNVDFPPDRDTESSLVLLDIAV